MLDVDFSSNYVFVCGFTYSSVDCAVEKKQWVKNNKKLGTTEVYIKLKADFAGSGEAFSNQHFSAIIPRDQLASNIEFKIQL